MSDIIEFLETLGANAHLRQASRDELSIALADAKVDAWASEAILARDAGHLYALLSKAPLCCVQTIPRKEGEEEEEREEEDGDGDSGTPAEPSSSAMPRILATA
jgi:hypothetical protein